MRSVKSLNDKRNLLDATDNPTVFGEGQVSTGSSRGKRRSHRLPRRHKTAANRSSVVTRSRNARASQPFLVPGPGSALKRLNKLTHFDVPSNDFLDTKPWKEPSTLLKISVEPHSKEKIVKTESHSLSSNFLDKLTSQNLIQSESHGVDFHVCPVCSKGFEPTNAKQILAADIMRHSMVAYQKQSGVQFRKSLEDGWGVSTKPKSNLQPQDVVVSANCGELFHKICLRDWCSRGHKLSPRSQKPTSYCPSCGKELKYTMCQAVEIVPSFSNEPTVTDRELTQTKLVNQELQLLWPETSTYLTKLQNDIKYAETLFKGMKSKKRTVKAQLKKLTAEDLSVVMSKVTDDGTMKVMLDKQEKALDFMQQETLQIMRMYLMTIIRKRKSTSVSIEDSNANEACGVFSINKIPPLLSRHLQSILHDDHALQLLSRIIAPMPEEANNEEKRNRLELELLEKYDLTSKNMLTRTSTYTVLSSVAEIRERDTDSAGKKREGFETKDQTNSPTDEERLPTFLKTVTAMHKLPAEKLKLSSERLLLQPKSLSEGSFLKPSRLLQIEDLISSNKFLEIHTSAGLEINKVTLDDREAEENSDSEENDTEEGEEEGDETVENLEYVSPLVQFPLPSSFKPFQWFSRGEEFKKPSSLEVSAISILSQQEESVLQDDNDVGKEHEGMREWKPMEQSSAIQNTSIDQQPLTGRMDIQEAIRHFLDQPSEKGTTPEPVVEEEEQYVLLAPTAETEDDEEEEDESWTTMSSDEDEVNPFIPVEIIPSPPPPTVPTSSCELVFRAKDRKQKKKGIPNHRQIDICHGQATVSSDVSKTSVPERQVSIAIMYIIDNDDDSGSEMGECEILAKSTPDENSVPNPLTPVHVEAEKTSNYSLIASLKSSSSSTLDVDSKITAASATPISDAVGLYRPPCMSSWSNGIPLENTAIADSSRSRKKIISNSPSCYREQEQTLPTKAEVGGRDTRLFYENEMKDKLAIGSKISSNSTSLNKK